MRRGTYSETGRRVSTEYPFINYFEVGNKLLNREIDTGTTLPGSLGQTQKGRGVHVVVLSTLPSLSSLSYGRRRRGPLDVYEPSG